jgi:hypothetical protein
MILKNIFFYELKILHLSLYLFFFYLCLIIAYFIFKLNVSHFPIQEEIFFQFPIFFISKQTTLMSENNKGISFALGYRVNISKRSENEPAE